MIACGRCGTFACTTECARDGLCAPCTVKQGSLDQAQLRLLPGRAYSLAFNTPAVVLVFAAVRVVLLSMRVPITTTVRGHAHTVLGSPRGMASIPYWVAIAASTIPSVWAMMRFLAASGHPVRSPWLAIRKRGAALVATVVTLFVIVNVAVLVCVLPALYAFAATALVLPAILLGETSLGTAYRRSYELTRAKASEVHRGIAITGLPYLAGMTATLVAGRTMVGLDRADLLLVDVCIGLVLAFGDAAITAYQALLYAELAPRAPAHLKGAGDPSPPTPRGSHRHC